MWLWRSCEPPRDPDIRKKSASDEADFLLPQLAEGAAEAGGVICLSIGEEMLVYFKLQLQKRK